jgi:glycosyltransferase involved in cell wall biosynthesis
VGRRILIRIGKYLMVSKMKTAVVIPAYNEEKTIADIVKRARKYCDHVIVIDDCSSDRTGRVAQRVGAETFKHTENKGAGAATRTGLELAQSFDIVITLDGDGQHNPDEIPVLLEPLKPYSNVGVVVGSRFMPRRIKSQRRVDYLDEASYVIEQYEYIEIPKYRKFGIDVITWLYNLGHSNKVKDAQSCFRAYSRPFLNKLSIEENGFGFSVEVLLKARKMGFGIVEVPISCIYRSYKQDSTLNPIRHGLEVAWKTIWWRCKLWS